MDKLMNPLWYFMSYAHADATDRERHLVLEFHEDLARAVAKRAGSTVAETAGFFDDLDLEWGDKWPAALAGALRRCRTFVPLLSANYVGSDFCGREWAAFAERTAVGLDAKGNQRLIVPVLWVPPVERELPEIATELQFRPSLKAVPEQDERRRLKVFQDKGLEYIAKRKQSDYSGTYDTIVEQLATRLIEAALAHELPELPADKLSSIRSVESVFEKPDQPATAAADAPESCTARFVVVAAKQHEVTADRAQYYASEARQWRPFLPEHDRPVGLIAQDSAGHRNLFCDWLLIDDALVQQLRKAEEHKNVAIMLIDPWTAQISPYREELMKFDECAFFNLAVIVVWPPGNRSENMAMRQGLETALERRFKQAHPNFLREAEAHPAQLDRAIRSALDDLEMVLAPRRQPVRTIAAEGVTTLPSVEPNKGLQA